MSRKFVTGLRKGLLSLENEDGQAMVDVVDGGGAGEEALPEVVDHTEELEQAVIEVAEAEAEGDTAEELVEDAVEAVTALEGIADKMKLAAKNGGMDRSAAGIAQDYVNFVRGSVGLPKSAGLPSLESFGGTGTRVSSTQLALEDVKETIAKVWANILAAIQRAWEWAKGYFFKVFGAYERLEKRATALAERAAKTTGKAEKSTIEDNGLAMSLRINGAVPTDIKTKAVDMSAALQTLLKSVSTKPAEELIKVLGGFDGKQDAAAIDAGLATVLKSIADASPMDTVTGAGKSGMKAEDGVVLEESEESFGGKVLYALIPKTADKFKSLKFGVAKTKETVSSKNVTLLSAEDCKVVAESVAAVGKAGVEFRKTQDSLNALEGKFSDAAKKIAKAVGGEGGEAMKPAAEKLRQGALTSIKLLTGIHQPALAAAVDMSRALLGLVEKSLGAIGAPAKAAEKPAA